MLKSAGGASLDNQTFANPTITGAVTGTATGLPFVYAKWTIPVITGSSGSIGNNGALTGFTATPARLFAEGAYVYYPANAIAAGVAAGFYWTVFSSTTAGTIYNSTYTTGVPVAGTLTAFATTGPGAYTGSTTEQGVTITLPALPAGTVLRITTLWEGNAVANTKSIRIRLGGAAGTAYLSQNANNGTSIYDQRQIICLTTAKQIGQTGASVSVGVLSGVVPVTSTVDTSTTSTLVLSTEHPTATDWLGLSQAIVEIIY
jgi:hypothetical protein